VRLALFSRCASGAVVSDLTTTWLERLFGPSRLKVSQAATFTREVVTVFPHYETQDLVSIRLKFVY
jgi:hypothetical protein